MSLLSDTILFTKDLVQRYRITRRTLSTWQSDEKKPKGFSTAFPSPDFPGNPNKWRESTVKRWEAELSKH